MNKLQRIVSSNGISGLLRTAPRNPSPLVRSHCPKTSHSLAYTAIRHHPTHLLSPIASTLPSRNVWSKAAFGFLSGSVVSKQFSVGALLTVATARRGLTDFRPAFLKTRFISRGFMSNVSFDSRRGWRSWLAGASSDGVVYGLILANVAVYMLWRVADQTFMLKNFMISLDNVMSGRVHTIITSAFSHIDTGHIMSNMIGLYFFGMSIGSAFGPDFLLKLYLAGAIGGSVFYLAHHAFLAASKHNQTFLKDPSRIPALGASGAVNAIMLLNIFLFPKSTLYFDFVIPVPAMLLGIFIIGKDVLRILEGDSQISGSAHLGGAAVAALTWARLRKGRF